MILEGTQNIDARRVGREMGVELGSRQALGSEIGLMNLTHHLLCIPLLESLSPVHEFKALICKQLLVLGSQAIANDLIAAEEQEQQQRQKREEQEAAQGQGLEKSQGSRYRTKTTLASLKLKKGRQEGHKVSIESYEEEEPVVVMYDDSEGE